MRYFLLAGEASGDHLGALLIAQLRRLDPMATFAFWGGDAMAEVGDVAPRQHIRDLAFMGYVEVVQPLPRILGLMATAKRDVADFSPDVLVCIDYPGFNLRIGRWARARGIRVDFYVSPQIWAWRRGRVHRVMRSTSRVLCVLPFEPKFYSAYGYEVSYCGHPLPKRVDSYQRPESAGFRSSVGATPRQRIVAVLPGSRRQEVAQILPIYLEAVTRLRALDPDADLRFVIAAAPALDTAELERASTNYDFGLTRDMYALLAHAEIAWTASGTATLEAALFGVPQVVCYRTGAITAWLARRMIKVPYIALANLILGEAAVPELIQDEFTAGSLVRWTRRALETPDERLRQRQAYAHLRERLAPYDAAATAADLIVADAHAAAAARRAVDLRG